MSVKAKVEALIYATEEPVTLNQLATLLKDAVLAELIESDRFFGRIDKGFDFGFNAHS